MSVSEVPGLGLLVGTGDTGLTWSKGDDDWEEFGRVGARVQVIVPYRDGFLYGSTNGFVGHYRRLFGGLRRQAFVSDGHTVSRW